MRWRDDELTGVLHIGYMDTASFDATGTELFTLPLLRGIDPGQVRLLSETMGYGFYGEFGNLLENVTATAEIRTE